MPSVKNGGSRTGEDSRGNKAKDSRLRSSDHEWIRSKSRPMTIGLAMRGKAQLSGAGLDYGVDLVDMILYDIYTVYLKLYKIQPNSIIWSRVRE